MALRYSFEKVRGAKEEYQVRLNGQFVTYVDRKDSKLVDELLAEAGWESREQFLEAAVERSKVALKSYLKA